MSVHEAVLTPAGTDAWPSRQLRLLAALLAAFVLALAAPAASVAGGDGGGDQSGRGGDNVATAINEEDGSSVFDLAFSVRRVAGEVVDEQNLAQAYGSCVECQTVAIALQIVLVEGSPDSVIPTNLAVAVNEECTACTTVALAYQFVVGGGDPVRFTEKGLKRLAMIRRKFERLGRLDLSPEELRRQADELADEVRDVIDNELVPDRGDDDKDGGEGNDDGGGPKGGEDGKGRSDGSGSRGGSGASDDEGGAGAGTGRDREPADGDGPSNGGESGGSSGAGDSGASPNGGPSGGGQSPENAPSAGSGSSSGGGASP